ncbi:CdaR family transcriptional regulator [Halobacillus litoralis]|uniref:CdaR family transcriptional regulator n=1 Tax=Halobacillus litoralis TaxID=45668 RepID=UPI002491E42D|nr:sugar diacid recognition domain-containing protein [Halobacillus litoralis]
MELTSQLGHEIINRLSKYINVPINLMDSFGKIVASTDTSRIDQLHGGAQQVIKTLEPQKISPKDTELFSNTKPGVNLPIFHRGELAGVVGLTGEPDKVYQAAGMTQGSVEIALEQMYIQRQAFYQERQWSHWLHQLLQPDDIDVVELEKEAQYTLKIDIKKTWQVILFQTESPFELAESIRKIAEAENIEPLFVLPYQENMVVVPLPYNHSLPSCPDRDYMGIGEPGYAIRGIRASFKQAQEAIQLSGEKGKPVYSEFLKMDRLLHHIDGKTYQDITKLYAHRLKKIESPYVDTLHCYFECDLKMNRTAEKLHIHRNTLLYRLDQLSKKVGLDPRKFKDAVILQSILINN